LFTSSGTYYFNTRGRDEKYLQGAGNQWYYILPSGQFYQWTGNIDTSKLLGTLDITYWSDPSLLMNAPPATGATSYISLNTATGAFTFQNLNGPLSLLVQASVTDGVVKVKKFFKVTVTT
jgi:hypothetical protein